MNIIHNASNPHGQLSLSVQVDNPKVYLADCGEDLKKRMTTFIKQVITDPENTNNLLLPIPCELHQSIQAPLVMPGIAVKVLSFSTNQKVQKNIKVIHYCLQHWHMSL